MATTPADNPSTEPDAPDKQAVGPAGSNSGTPKRPTNWRLVFSHLLTFATIVLLAAAGVGLYFGIRPMEKRAATLIADRAATVRFTWPAASAKEPSKTWMPRVLQEQLTAEAQAIINQTPDPFSAEPLAALARHLAESGWFEQTPVVQRDDRAGYYGVEVRGNWRVPAALVRWNGVDRIISWKSEPMPPNAPSSQTSDLVIVGVASAPPTRQDGSIDYTKTWSAEELGAALELLSVINVQNWKMQVQAVEVQEYGRHKKLTVVTRYGTRVVWGGRPNKPLVGEASTQLKLANIATLVRDTKRIDGGYPLIYMDQPTPTFDISATASALMQAEQAKGEQTPLASRNGGN